MSSNQVHAVQGVALDAWSKRLQNLSTTVTKVTSVRDQLREELVEKEDEVSRLASKADVLTKVLELYRVLMDKLILNQTRIIEKVVTEGLQTIFYDQNLSFLVETSQWGNRVSVEFYICKGNPDKGGIKGEPIGSFGGGPSVMTSLILRLLTLLRLKRYPVVFLDETLSAVSDGYIELSGRFLQKLSETGNIDILLVTHKTAFLEYADSAYQGNSRLNPGRPDEFHVRRVKGPK